jgi:hypothetical protein
MQRKDVLKRLCALCYEVGEQLSEDLPHDCFCLEAPNFQFSEEIIKFIEDSVREKL